VINEKLNNYNLAVKLNYIACFSFFALFFLSGCASVVYVQKSTYDKKPNLSEDVLQTLRLQIFLDSMNYGPGVIDGKRGFFTERAAKVYSHSTGLNLPDERVLTKELPRVVPEIFAIYEVSLEDFKYVGPLPSTPEEQSKLKFLSYESIAELVAERYRTTVDFLRLCNPDLQLGALTIGSQIFVPNVRPFEIENLRKLHRLPKNMILARNMVYVALEERYLKVTDPRGRILAYFPITPGSVDVRPPIGEWKILGIVTLPVFRWDDSLLKEGVRSDKAHLLPPGPNSPVGVLWAGLNKPGIGIHGTNSPETIGRATSSGCIRLSNWDAVTFSKLVSEGSKVVIRP
jgi:hypothetical protein